MSAKNYPMAGLRALKTMLDCIHFTFKLCNIFNMDETALFATIPRYGTKQSKMRLTLAFTTNGDGTECLPPLIIGHAKRPRCFQKKTGEQLGFQYYSNTRA
ncbi:hypothetical protein G9A89_004125 [Geosiphon pyriformis]|nr:hypothetical protein G9A89_004125 [Geosiphon pyriformis]